ncbi:hypothetical protein BHM03_00014390, partial [Ensete ventricosum]
PLSFGSQILYRYDPSPPSRNVWRRSLTMDDIDGMPLAKRRRLPILTKRVSMEVPKVNWLEDHRADMKLYGFTYFNRGHWKKWPGLPRGVNFNPSDEDLLWHLVAKVGKGNADPHPFIHEFITCLDEFEAFGYTHPQKLPGN